MSRTETQSIESNASCRAAFGLLAGPARIPEWAPDFADRVTGDARSGWRAAQDGRDFALRVVADEHSGTVDYLREVAPGREGGAYLRAVPRPGGGCVIVMTVPAAPGADPAQRAAALARELRALAVLLDQPGTDPAARREK
jgi:hypothetical protein